MTHLIRSLFIAALALPVLALWLSAGASVAEANGQTVSILETTQGAYHVDVRVSPPSPRVGSLHMSICAVDSRRRRAGNGRLCQR